MANWKRKWTYQGIGWWWEWSNDKWPMFLCQDLINHKEYMIMANPTIPITEFTNLRIDCTQLLTTPPMLSLWSLRKFTKTIYKETLNWKLEPRNYAHRRVCGNRMIVICFGFDEFKVSEFYAFQGGFALQLPASMKIVLFFIFYN